SGSVCVSSRGKDGEITFREWHPVGIIEYGYAAPDPLNPDIVYGAGRREVSKFSVSTGQFQNVTPVPAADPKVRADRTQPIVFSRSEEHTSELQSRGHLVCRLLLEKKNVEEVYNALVLVMAR